MGLLDLPDEILHIIVEQIRSDAFSGSPGKYQIPHLSSLCALALTARRFSVIASEAIHREIRLVGNREAAEGDRVGDEDQDDEIHKARWRCWTQSCNEYPQLLEKVRIIRATWFTSFDKDLKSDMYSCVGRASNLERLSVSVWSRTQQDWVLARIGIEPWSFLNLRILKLSFHTKRHITIDVSNRICQLPSLDTLILKFKRIRFDTELNEADLGGTNEPKEGIVASKLTKVVFDCRFVERQVLDFFVRRVPELKQLTIPEKIGTHRNESETSYSQPIPIRPTMIDMILRPLTDSLEQLTITSAENYYPRDPGKMDCERPVGFSKFRTLKSLDVPSHFLFDLSEDGDTYLRTNYDLFPKSLKSLKLRFEYFFTIHELEQEWGMTAKDWHKAYLPDISYEMTGCIVYVAHEPIGCADGSQPCRWVSSLLNQDKEAIRTLRQAYARDRDFDITRHHIVAIDRKIPDALDGVDVEVRIRTTKSLLEAQARL